MAQQHGIGYVERGVCVCVVMMIRAEYGLLLRLDTKLRLALVNNVQVGRLHS